MLMKAELNTSLCASALGALFACAAVPAQARALPQTPETAVAYLLFGIEDGADGKLDGVQRWRRVAGKAALFRAGKLSLKVERTGECTFTATKTESDGPFVAKIDLKRISKWQAAGNQSRVEGDGLCLAYAGQCPAKAFDFQVPRIDAGTLNWNETYAWLKANTCKG
jgi:hypothetical protein